MSSYFEFPQIRHFAERLKNGSTYAEIFLYFEKYFELSIAHCTST
jgi:hypothetical protein